MFLPEEGSQPRLPIFPFFDTCAGCYHVDHRPRHLGVFKRERDADAEIRP
jgi:hypothetical protein